MLIVAGPGCRAFPRWRLCSGSMLLPTSPYTEQAAGWPGAGRHILAHSDETSVIVYQAYRPEIGRDAARHRRFGGGNFSWSRMSWIKPNFVWMMSRSGWGTKEGQEVTLAVRLSRTFFDELLAQAVPSAWDPALHATREAWQEAVAVSNVRVQWDPDHDPSGAPLARRALQLGLRGQALRQYGDQETLDVIDLSAFVERQREHARAPGYRSLITPVETVYQPTNVEVRTRLRLDAFPGADHAADRRPCEPG